MLWVNHQYKYVNSFSAGTVFIRENLMSTDVGFLRIKIPVKTTVVFSTYYTSTVKSILVGTVNNSVAV